MLRLLNRGEGSLVYSFLFMCAGFLLLTAWGWGDLMATDWAALPGLVLGGIAMTIVALGLLLKDES